MGFSHLNIPSDIKAKAIPVYLPKRENATTSKFYLSGNLNVFSQRIKDRLNLSMYSEVKNHSQIKPEEHEFQK
jgi:hypothetical protein